MLFDMVKEIVLYMAGLISLITLMLLANARMKVGNKILLALAAPIVGGLFILLGTVFLLFLFALVIFGGVLYLINKKMFKRWFSNGPKFSFYRSY